MSTTAHGAAPVDAPAVPTGDPAILGLPIFAAGSVALNKAAGYVVLAFAALGLYLFLSTASVSAGGRGYPLGRPLVR
jgi:hypothetical protein